MRNDWSGRAAQDALARVKANGRRHRTPCCICNGHINYGLPSTHRLGCTVQHVKSRHLYPELTWDPSNWAPAHLTCNTSVGDGTRASPYDLGLTSM